MKATKKSYRVRHEDSFGNRHYIVRYEGRSNVLYQSASEVPLALSNCFHNDAAEIRFALEDARDGVAAARIIKKWYMEQHRPGTRYAELASKVVVLA
jgi:hypothetical protein